MKSGPEAGHSAAGNCGEPGRCISRQSPTRMAGVSMKRQLLQRCTPHSRGAAAVEMAFIAPVFFLLVFGLIEFSRMVMVQQALTNAARSGARKAALSTTQNSSDVDAAVRDYLSATIPNSSNAEQCRITVSPSTLSTATSGTDITITVEVTYSDISWFPATFLGNSVVKGQATMERE